MKSLVLAPVFLLLAGCGAYEHFQSQERLTTGVEALRKAETTAISGDSDIPEVFNSAQSLRLALADDAKSDLTKAQRSFGATETEDRISALSRAALKGWQAGKPGGAVVDSATSLGDRLCRNLGSAAPPRDCGLLVIKAHPEPDMQRSVAQVLSTLEIQADTILPYSRIGAEQLLGAGKAGVAVAQLNKAISATIEALPRLSAPPAILGPWVERQRLIYTCTAVAGHGLLRDIGRRPEPANITHSAKTAAQELTPGILSMVATFNEEVGNPSYRLRSDVAADARMDCDELSAAQAANNAP